MGLHCNCSGQLHSISHCRNGIYPLMNFASSRPHPVPRALSLSQEQVETVKTPTPEPQETESRKVRLSDVKYTILCKDLYLCFSLNCVVDRSVY